MSPELNSLLNATDITALVVGPDPDDPGGVANYYNAVMPYLRATACPTVRYLAIGKRGGATRLSQVLSDQQRFRRALADLDPGIVHLNPSMNPKSFFRDALFAYETVRQGRKLLVFFRGWNDQQATVLARWFGWWFRASLGQADEFIVLSQDIAAQLRSWGVTSPVAVDSTVVPDTLLDGFCVAPKLEAMAAAQTPLKVLFMARLEASKGALETLEAVLKLREAGHPVELTIAGDGPAMAALRERVEADGRARDGVTLAGYVRGDDKHALLASHHVFCMPTYYGEGMPNALIEAMAFGMAVVTCAAGGIKDMFLDGSMGSLVPPRDADAVAHALRELQDDRSKLAAAGRFNHDYAKRRLLASQAAERLLAIYRRLAA